MSELQTMNWKVHASRLLQEILSNPGTGILHQPLRILGKILAEVGERAAELDDPILNDLMCRLAIYSVSDPYSPEYCPETVRKVSELREKALAEAQQPEADEITAEQWVSQTQSSIDALEKANARIAELEEERRWVPVSERLPEFCRHVDLASFDGDTHVVVEGYLMENGGWYRLVNNYRDETITHWCEKRLPPFED